MFSSMRSTNDTIMSFAIDPASPYDCLIWWDLPAIVCLIWMATSPSLSASVVSPLEGDKNRNLESCVLPSLNAREPRPGLMLDE